MTFFFFFSFDCRVCLEFQEALEVTGNLALQYVHCADTLY